MPPMNVLGLGAWPENLAPEKSKPGCCTPQDLSLGQACNVHSRHAAHSAMHGAQVSLKRPPLTGEHTQVYELPCCIYAAQLCVNTGPAWCCARCYSTSFVKQMHRSWSQQESCSAAYMVLKRPSNIENQCYVLVPLVEIAQASSAVALPAA